MSATSPALQAEVLLFLCNFYTPHFILVEQYKLKLAYAELRIRLLLTASCWCRRRQTQRGMTRENRGPLVYLYRPCQFVVSLAAPYVELILFGRRSGRTDGCVAGLMDSKRDVTVTSTNFQQSARRTVVSQAGPAQEKRVGESGPINTATHRSLIGSRLLRQRDVITAAAAASPAASQVAFTYRFSQYCTTPTYRPLK